MVLEEMDNWLSKLPEPVPGQDDVITTGVGIYHFISENNVETKNIKDLLEKRSAKKD